MVGHRRGQVERPSGGMRQSQSKGMQVQLVRNTLGTEIDVRAGFGVADNGMADLGKMRADLVRAACHRLDREPSKLVAGTADHCVIGRGGQRVILLQFGLAHAIAVRAAGFLQGHDDLALCRSGHPMHKRPVDLARRSCPKRLRQLAGR